MVYPAQVDRGATTAKPNAGTIAAEIAHGFATRPRGDLQYYGGGSGILQTDRDRLPLRRTERSCGLLPPVILKTRGNSCL